MNFTPNSDEAPTNGRRAARNPLQRCLACQHWCVIQPSPPSRVSALSLADEPRITGCRSRTTRIVAESLATRRRRCSGMTALSGGSGDASGGSGDGADPVGMSTLAPLVTVSAVTFARSRKVARNVLR